MWQRLFGREERSISECVSERLRACVCVRDCLHAWVSGERLGERESEREGKEPNSYQWPAWLVRDECGFATANQHRVCVLRDRYTVNVGEEDDWASTVGSGHDYQIWVR